MKLRSRNPEKIVRATTVATLLFIVCWGFITVVLEIKPFWVDEWRVIYNLKFKTPAMLWGQLDFLQQFPRVYLQIIKAFTSLFNYNYFSLRLPSWLVGTATIVFCYRLMNKIFPGARFNKYLFVMILVSACTFTDYYVQIKQYTMDLLLTLLALWQYMELIELRAGKIAGSRYFLLCFSFLIAPFFSYIYPICTVPVFLILAAWTIVTIRNKGFSSSALKSLFRQWFPLLLCADSTVVFYIADVSQLMADKGMHKFWGHLIMDNGFSWSLFFSGLYNLFAEVGAGVVYWYLFGILGLVSFLSGISRCVKIIVRGRTDQYSLILLYCTSLLLVTILLFIAGKFPLGEPRLNAFIIPSFAVLLIQFLDDLKEMRYGAVVARTLSVIFYIGVTGNIYTTFIASITGPEYARKLETYRSTEKAIALAQGKNLPILITPDVAWPYDKTLNYPFKNNVPGDWVLKTFPAYDAAKGLPVMHITSLAAAEDTIKQLPANVPEALAGDGRNYRIVRK